MVANKQKPGALCRETCTSSFKSHAGLESGLRKLGLQDGRPSPDSGVGGTCPEHTASKQGSQDEAPGVSFLVLFACCFVLFQRCRFRRHQPW